MCYGLFVSFVLALAVSFFVRKVIRNSYHEFPDNFFALRVSVEIMMNSCPSVCIIRGFTSVNIWQTTLLSKCQVTVTRMPSHHDTSTSIGRPWGGPVCCGEWAPGVGTKHLVTDSLAHWRAVVWSWLTIDHHCTGVEGLCLTFSPLKLIFSFFYFL